MIRPNVNLPQVSSSEAQQPVHPLGREAKVLLTSVFGPYGQDDEYGSRRLNPMELYQNQVTREQGPFSLRMFHRSWGLMMIQANIEAPCTLLDFPTLDRFIEEIRTHQYDIVGISSIIPNLLKVRKMCELVRQYLPGAKIVVGGHIANIPDLAQRIDADYIVRGDGIRWFRLYLGEDVERPIRHPEILSGYGTRNMGITVKEKPGDVAATLIPSVGCPFGCNFCSTSAMFGGKGKFVNFYETGDELFDIMDQLARSMQVRSFFVMDENFLLHRRRALRLLELMERHNKPWSINVFSSANVLRSYTIDQLVRLGVSWVWMGLEGENSQYAKLHGIDTFDLVRTLQSHGIKVLGSTILGLENHTPDNIDAAIDYAIRHDTDFHQFMLYTPIPGTPLYRQLAAEGRLKPEGSYHIGDVHGQYILNYYHPHIPPGMEVEIVRRAFARHYQTNGPSIARIVRTMLSGWRRYKDCPDQRVRDRVRWECRELGTTYVAVAAACYRYFADQPHLRAKMADLLHELYSEFGWKARFYAAVGGRYLSWTVRREEKRLAAGWTYEPPTFYTCNEPALEEFRTGAAPELARWVQPRTARPSQPVGFPEELLPRGQESAPHLPSPVEELLAGPASPKTKTPSKPKVPVSI
ncbi:MAG TPA: cobalamin-dependent protein [Thermoguttaceae bacterium]|nr:cobalamin-dependent protein [Thermoguttaceae bacterium]